MKAEELKKLESRLDNFLRELTAPMGRNERRQWASIYMRGLLLDGERKSIEPMAQRVGGDVQAMQQFIGQSPWPTEPVLRRLARMMAEEFEPVCYWIIDETSFPKAGEHSVGVARQYCGTLGKTANCQVAVSLHWSGEVVAFPVSWRLFLPDRWIRDPPRCREAGIPEEVIGQTKPELALELIKQAREWDLPRGTVLADSLYGDSSEWRVALRQWHMPYCVAVDANTLIWTQPPQLRVQAYHGQGPRPRRALPQVKPQSLKDVVQRLKAKGWHRVKWREGTEEWKTSRFALLPVWAAHDWRQGKQKERPQEWLLTEWPEDNSEPAKFWLIWKEDQEVGLRASVRAAKARWRIELDYRQLKDELGLDHFEGRGWMGWHHHVTMVTLAYAFLRREQARYKKKDLCDLTDDSALTLEGAYSSERQMPVVRNHV